MVWPICFLFSREFFIFSFLSCVTMATNSSSSLHAPISCPRLSCVLPMRNPTAVQLHQSHVHDKSDDFYLINRNRTRAHNYPARSIIRFALTTTAVVVRRTRQNVQNANRNNNTNNVWFRDSYIRIVFRLDTTTAVDRGVYYNTVIFNNSHSHTLLRRNNALLLLFLFDCRSARALRVST